MLSNRFVVLLPDEQDVPAPLGPSRESKVNTASRDVGAGKPSVIPEVVTNNPGLSRNRATQIQRAETSEGPLREKTRNLGKEIFHGHRRPPPPDMDRQSSRSAKGLRKDSARARQAGWGQLVDKTEESQVKTQIDAQEIDKSISESKSSETEDSKFKTLKEYFQSVNLNKQTPSLPARTVSDDDEKWGQAVDIIRRKDSHLNHTKPYHEFTVIRNKNSLQIDPIFPRKERRDRGVSSKPVQDSDNRHRRQLDREDLHPKFKPDDFPVLS